MDKYLKDICKTEAGSDPIKPEPDCPDSADEGEILDLRALVLTKRNEKRSRSGGL